MGSRQGAFTIIELLVVLVIMSLGGALIAPDLWNVFERSNERGKVLELAIELKKVQRSAYQNGKAVDIDFLGPRGRASVLPRLPDGWTLLSATPIEFLPTGVTNGGKLVMESNSGRQWQLELGPLQGAIDIQPFVE